MRLSWWGLGALLLGSAPLWAWSKADLSNWQATDMDAALAHRFINNQVCSSTPDYFQSCLRALRKLGAIVEAQVTPADHYDFEAALEGVVQREALRLPAAFVYGQAVNEHLRFFDAHASLQPTHRLSTDERFAGVGVELVREADGLRVREVIPHSPAARAKIEIGDILLSAGSDAETDLTHADEDAAEDVLRGAVGSELHIHVQRGDTALKFTLRRALVVWPNVEFRLVSERRDIAYIKVRNFVAGETCNQVRQALSQADGAGVHKYILDLRGNPGGGLEDALCTSGFFVGWRNIVGLRSLDVAIPERDLIRVYRTSSTLQWKGGYGSPFLKGPTVVLVDSATASSAEIVAGSLQLANVAWLVGERTYGKGSFQSYSTLAGHPSLTIAATTGLYFFTNHLSDQRVGLVPDFEVSFAREDLHPLREEDVYENALPAQNASWRSRPLMRECVAPLAEPNAQDKQLDYGVAVLRSSSGNGDINCHPLSF